MTLADRSHRRTIHGLLKEKIAQRGNREFLVFQDQSYGYKDLDHWSDRTAAGFQKLGLKKGDKAAIIMTNRPEFIFTWFGLCKLGAIEVPLNVAHRGQILSYMLEQSDCRIAVVEAPFLPQLAEVASKLTKLEKVIVLDDPPPDSPRPDLPFTTYHHLVENDGAFRNEDVIWRGPLLHLVHVRHHRTLQGRAHAPQLRGLYGRPCAEVRGIFRTGLLVQCTAVVSRQRPAPVHNARTAFRRQNGSCPQVFSRDSSGKM
jgi:acyl-CoA synthetase (AMP-forming)/AMP-acid ligase II